MSYLNHTFCSLYLKDVRKNILKLLPYEAIKGVTAFKYSPDYYQVTIPKNNWFPNGFSLDVKATCANEAKSSALSHIIMRLQFSLLEDSQYPIIIKSKYE